MYHFASVFVIFLYVKRKNWVKAVQIVQIFSTCKSIKVQSSEILYQNVHIFLHFYAFFTMK